MKDNKDLINEYEKRLENVNQEIKDQMLKSEKLREEKETLDRNFILKEAE